jgi:hypothetical protein
MANRRNEEMTTESKADQKAAEVSGHLQHGVIDDVKFTFKLGSVESKTFSKFENGRIATYSFSIHRDQRGIETHRIEPTRLGSIRWGDGSPFTQREYNKLVSL